MTIKLQLTQNSKHSLIRIGKANHHKGYNVVMMALQNRKTPQTGLVNTPKWIEKQTERVPIYFTPKHHNTMCQ